MIRIALAIALFTACSTTNAAAPPAPQVKNLALDFAERWIGKVDPGAKCSPWTGAGTAIKGVDSVLCSKEGASVIIYCAAPFDGKPRCEMAADWTAQPQQTVQQPVAPKVK